MEQVLATLKDGGVALVATDTVFGLAALPDSAGCNQIFQLKRRPAGQALPWLVGEVSQLDELSVDIQPYARRLAQRYWPGALTLVVKSSDAALAAGAGPTVALRMPDDEGCLSLLRQLGQPLACTSANLHGEPAPGTFTQVHPSLAGLSHDARTERVTPSGIASTIVDCTGETPKILREGAITQQMVASVL